MQALKSSTTFTLKTATRPSPSPFTVRVANVGSGSQVQLHFRFLPLWSPVLAVAPSQESCSVCLEAHSATALCFHLRHALSHDLDIFSDLKTPRTRQVSGSAWVRCHPCSIQLILRIRQGKNVEPLVESHRCITGKVLEESIAGQTKSQTLPPSSFPCPIIRIFYSMGWGGGREGCCLLFLKMAIGFAEGFLPSCVLAGPEGKHLGLFIFWNFYC